MEGRVKWGAISPHQACKEGEFEVTTKHARRGEMVGHFASQTFNIQGGVKCLAINPHQACKQKEFGVTTKHAWRGEMVGHFTSPSMQARRVWADNQACKENARKESLR